MRYITQLTLLAVLMPTYHWANAQEESSDTLFIQRNEKGKIEFARFKVNENSDRKMSNDTIFLKSILWAKPEDGFRVKNETKDELGITHRKYQQYYKGIKVENAEYLLHGKDNNIEVINGDYQDVNIQIIKPVISEQQAYPKHYYGKIVGFKNI